MYGLAALAGAYILSLFFRSFLAVMTPVLSRDLGMTNSDFALALGIWFVTFAAMQFAVGVSLDRYGPRRTASFLLGTAGLLGAILFALATTPMMIIAAMALIGIGCSPVLMSSLFIFAKTYSPQRFASLAATFIAIGLAGAVFGSSPLAYAIGLFGWRNVMWGLAGLTLIIALAIFVLIKDPEQEEGNATAGFSGYLELFKIRQLWPIFPLAFVGYATMAGIRGLWAGPYLTELQDADITTIGSITFAMSVAMVVATLAYGPMDRMFNSRKYVVLGANIILLFCILAFVIAPQMPIFWAAITLTAIAIFGSVYPVLTAHARGFYPRHLVGRGVTLLNFFSIGGAGAMQFLTGGIVASQGGGGLQAFTALFVFYATALVMASVIYAFSKDVKPSET